MLIISQESSLTACTVVRHTPSWLVLVAHKRLASSPRVVGHTHQVVALHAALKLEGTYIDELVYRHPTDDLYIDETDTLYEEGINEFTASRFGFSAQLAVGF